jgi:CRP-like cAMP-binding protein
MEPSEIESVLSGSELFRGLDSKDIAKVASLCRSESYEAGDEVFRQGDFGEYLHVIVEGQVVLERAMDMGTRRGQVTIGMLGRGRAFGCWSTVLGETHNLMSTATCQKPTRVLVIRGADLRDMMMSNTSLGFNLLERLCFLLRDRIQGAYGAMEKI